MLLAALAYVAVYGSDVPFWDDWNLVAVLVGDQPVTPRWLWSEYNGHRLPLPKLTLLALYRLTGCDFRAGMYLNVLALGALAFVLIRTAGALRGGVAYADAFFPLALLHWGHGGIFLHSFTVNLVLPTALAGLFLALTTRWGTRPPPGPGVLAGMALLALPLCGMPGLVYVPALAVWLVGAGIRHGRSAGRRERRQGLATCGLVAAALGLTGLYFFRYQTASYYLQQLHAGRSLRAALQFLSGGFGPAARAFWPFSGYGVAALWLLSVGVLLAAAWRQPLCRPRAVGLLFFLAALAGLAASVGVGRPGSGFTPHYFLIAVPALGWLYFVWGACAPPAVGQVAQMALFSLMAFTLGLNSDEGRDFGRARRDRMAAFERDLRAGAPVYQLLARHAATVYPYPHGAGALFHDWLEDKMRKLHRDGVGTFRSLRPDAPPFREVPLPVDQDGPNPADVVDTPEGPALRVRLPGGPQFVVGVRLTYRTDPGGEAAPFEIRIYWKRPGQTDFPAAQRYIHYSHWQHPHSGSGRPRPGEKTMTAWVYERVSELRVHPAPDPEQFRVTEIVLLVPGGEGS